MKYFKIALYGAAILLVALLAFVVQQTMYVAAATGGGALLALAVVGAPVTLDIPTKPWYKSLTNWINGLSAIAMFIEAVTEQNLLPSPYNEYALAALAVINVMLRFKSDQPVVLSTTRKPTQEVTIQPTTGLPTPGFNPRARL